MSIATITQPPGLISTTGVRAIALLGQAVTTVVLHHSGHSRQSEGAVAASRGSTALPAAFSQVINLTWFKQKESKTDKRVLLETEGREEDLQLLILQNTGGWTLEGDASEQLEALFRTTQIMP